MNVLRSVEQRGGENWKRLLVSAHGITELPTRELLSFLTFIVDFFDIRAVVEFGAQHGMLSYLLRSQLPNNIDVVAIDDDPSRFKTTYLPVLKKTITSHLATLTRLRALRTLPNTLAVQLWPDAESQPRLEAVLQKGLVSVLAVIGEPTGCSCLGVKFDRFAKQNGYRVYVLPVKQVCCIDTATYHLATSAEMSRSVVTLYVHNDSLPGLSQDGFVDGFGSENFMKPPPEQSNLLILQDYILDRRVPTWVASADEKDLQHILELVTSIMMESIMFDGRIPPWIESVEQLDFWYNQMRTDQFPTQIDAKSFAGYYTAVTELPMLGILHFQRSIGMPAYIKRIEDAEKWLWTVNSQRVAMPGWDATLQSMRMRFHQLWSAAATERTFRLSSLTQQEHDTIRARIRAR
jgi:hypothetical protein